MNQYIGTKIVNAEPMTRLEYNELRDWELPTDENGADEGYLIEDINGTPNVEGYSGYVQWVTKSEFDRIYNRTENLTFGEALVALQQGKKLQRASWNGKGMYCIYVPGSEIKLRPNTPYHNAITDNGNKTIAEGETNLILPHIDMWTIDSSGRRAFLPGWLASQSDMLASDWQIIT